MIDRVIARRLGVPIGAVIVRRKKLGIAGCRVRRLPNPEEITLARELGLTS